jgi:hypothetical protein
MWSLEQIQKQLESIPRLSRSQFMALPREQREEYIKMIERLAAQTSVAMKSLLEKEREKNLQKISSETQKGHDAGVTDFRNAHYIMQAIELAAKKEYERRLSHLENIRNSIIQLDYHALWLDGIKNSEFKYGHYVSAKRLLHRLKYNNIDEANKQKCVQFIRNHCPMTAHESGLAKELNSQDSEFFDWITNASVILNDWLPKVEAYTEKEGIIYYIMDECFLYTSMYNNEKYKSYNRALEPSPEMESLREKLKQAREEVNKYNEQICNKWKTMPRIDRLRHYIKSEYISQFEKIEQQGRDIGLSDDKLVNLFLDEDKNKKLFTEEFKGDLETVPQRSVPEYLEKGVHQFSLELSKQLNIPERILVVYIPETILKDAYIRKDNAAIEQIYKETGIGTIIPEFIEYWKEVTIFDPRWNRGNTSALRKESTNQNEMLSEQNTEEQEKTSKGKKKATSSNSRL